MNKVIVLLLGITALLLRACDEAPPTKTQDDLAAKLCISNVPMASGNSPPTKQFSSLTRVLSAPSFEKPFLDFGPGLPIMTIFNGELSYFTSPPLDQWNKILPAIIVEPDGSTYAYTRQVKGKVLYKFDRSAGEFLRHPVSDKRGVKGFVRSNWRGSHENTRKDPDLSTSGSILVYVNDGLALLRDDKLVDMPLPPRWFRGNSGIPLEIEGLGQFTRVSGAIWYLNKNAVRWQQVAEWKSLQKQHPFSMLQGRYDEATGAVWLLLRDRVLVGRFQADTQKLEFDYQFVGDIVIHQPSQQILVWQKGALTEKQNQSLKTIVKSSGLWEMTSGSPSRVPGFRANVRTSGTKSLIPISESLFHQPSGVTLISHAGGFAAFDGKELKDLPQFTPPEGRLIYLRQLGQRYFATMHDWIAEIEDDLSIREVQLPEPLKPDSRVSLRYSEALEQYIMYSLSWETAYSSKDLQSFKKIDGDQAALISVPGDMPMKKAAITHLRDKVFLISECERQTSF